MAMDYKKLFTENTEESGIHREFLLENSNSLLGNKWGKENNKFFADFSSPPCLPSRSGGSGGIPCTNSEEQLNQVTQSKQDPNPRTIRNS
jgi:hypothetical protein